MLTRQELSLYNCCQVPQYELVEARVSKGWLQFDKGFMYHANFEAKPVGAPDNEAQLFFVEILSDRLPPRKKSRIVHKVLRCDPLERVSPACSADDILHGCLTCRYALAVYHPADGAFNVGPRWEHRIVPRENEDLC